ncbi:lactonase family protein [Plantactinospora soyae]|uniref:6-phosphogluconolactonase (Cycloisomerase 2 family) n=1 Tax=Plantactinospora soyae TaxID=1544732 RepID=A0A927M949_9ACTN|nr:beta-propeller fold lactonase family protein [Plantactinospora soyae]MBE1489357.1 6-phosphogluconolactonase (cycloisomerase 2 family) [Plantactinospora soyae]
MRRKRLATAVFLASLVGATIASGPVVADDDRWDHGGGSEREGLVFVQTNKPLGNTIKVYERGRNGHLTAAGEFETGGLGGATVGPPVDALASQDSLRYEDGLLFAVNAGSNTVTVFRVHDDGLERTDVIWSGGLLPVSIGVHDDLVYVLNAGGDGSVQGYRLDHGRLEPIRGAHRSLDLGNANPPAFGDAPAQLSVTPDGRFVLVSTKSHNTVEAYEIEDDGQLAEPVSNPAEGAPFGFTFDDNRGVLVTESGTNALARYRLDQHGKLSQVGPAVPNGQMAPCWVQRVGDYFYVANAGSSTISAYRIGDDGHLVLVAAVAVNTGGGSIDMTASGGFLYVQNAAAGNVQGYAVGEDGSLTLVTTVDGLPVFENGIGMEGIAAS